MLTQKDFDKIETLIDKKLEEKLKYLPTKEEFFSKMDELMKELKDMREEFTLLSGRQSEHSDQLDDHEHRRSDLEKKVVSA